MEIPVWFTEYPGVWCGWCDQYFDYYEECDRDDPLCQQCNNKKQNMGKQTLQEIFKEIGHFGNDIGCNDKNSTHTYLETYDRLFEPYRNGCNFMEIGLALGDSIKLFDRYFEKSTIVGVDISVVFQPEQYKNDVRIIEADATMSDFLRHIEDVDFDIVIDDGNHVTISQIQTFNLLKPKMKKGSIYIIEDLLALDIERDKYLALHENVEIIDMRDNGRFDNCLCIIRF